VVRVVKRHQELTPGERYERQPKTPGALTEKLAEHLKKARTLLSGRA